MENMRGVLSRVLIFKADSDWLGAERLPGAFAEEGYQVATLAPADDLITKSDFVVKRFKYPSREKLLFLSVFWVLEKWNPDIVIPGDEYAITILQHISEAGFSFPLSLKWKRQAHLIRKSLGNPQFWSVIRSKFEIQRIAAELDILTPENQNVNSIEDIFSYIGKYGYPVVLKKDTSVSGWGTYICRTHDEVIRMYEENGSIVKVNSRYPFLGKLLRGFGRINYWHVVKHFNVQRYIKGIPMTHIFSALNGEIKSQVSARVICNKPPNGPSSVVQFVKNEQIRQVAVKLIRKVGFTGFGCLDFMMEDDTQKIYLLEFNPRPTALCHLAKKVGINLFSAMRDSLTNRVIDEKSEPNKELTIALYPQEIMRDPNSKYVTTCYHDVPYKDNGLMLAISGLISKSQK